MNDVLYALSLSSPVYLIIYTGTQPNALDAIIEQ